MRFLTLLLVGSVLLCSGFAPRRVATDSCQLQITFTGGKFHANGCDGACTAPASGCESGGFSTPKNSFQTCFCGDNPASTPCRGQLHTHNGVQTIECIVNECVGNCTTPYEFDSEPKAACNCE